MRNKTAKLLRKILVKQEALKDWPALTVRMNRPYNKKFWKPPVIPAHRKTYIFMKDLVWLWHRTPHAARANLFNNLGE